MHDPLPFSCQAILFDLDGTLIDSTDRIDRLWKWWAARHGLDFDGLRDRFHGRTAVETLRDLAPELPLEDEIEALETEEVADMHDVRAIPGAHELLTGLDPRRWAIVTSGSPRVAEARIAHVGLPRPRVLVTADQVGRGKPAPDGYLLAARSLGFAPADCVVLEDAPVGVLAGKAAGMRVIAIATSHAPATLHAADAVVERLEDLVANCDRDGILMTAGHNFGRSLP